jgi:hypothetical protein
LQGHRSSFSWMEIAVKSLATGHQTVKSVTGLQPVAGGGKPWSG